MQLVNMVGYLHIAAHNLGSGPRREGILIYHFYEANILLSHWYHCSLYITFYLGSPTSHIPKYFTRVTLPGWFSLAGSTLAD